jgi:hypothetical protein
MSRRYLALAIGFSIAFAVVWRFTSDGEPTTATHTTPQVASGEEAASAAIAEPDLGRASRAEVAAGESLEPAHTTEARPFSALVSLRGRLDDAVPRPIEGGHVRVKLDRHEAGEAPPLERDSDIHADGTFELADLSPGRGQIVALCRGWVSRRTPFDPIEAVARRLEREPTMGEIEQAFQEEGPETLEAQRIVIPAPDPLVVAMERSGTLEVIAKTPGGSPFAGATVTATPGVHWMGTSSAAFAWRTWEATTDPWGRARIDDLPPDDALSVAASHDREWSTGGGVRRRWEYVVKIRSSETSELEIVNSGN